MIQDRANPGIPAKLQRLQGMTRLDGHGSEAALQCVLSHQVGGRRETAGPVLFPNRLPYLRPRDVLAKRAIDHAKAGCAAVPVSPRIRLSLVRYGLENVHKLYSALFVVTIRRLERLAN